MTQPKIVIVKVDDNDKVDITHQDLLNLLDEFYSDGYDDGFADGKRLGRKEANYKGVKVL